jgi:hypothetical protein
LLVVAQFKVQVGYYYNNTVPEYFFNIWNERILGTGRGFGEGVDDGWIRLTKSVQWFSFARPFFAIIYRKNILICKQSDQLRLKFIYLKFIEAQIAGFHLRLCLASKFHSNLLMQFLDAYLYFQYMHVYLYDWDKNNF